MLYLYELFYLIIYDKYTEWKEKDPFVYAIGVISVVISANVITLTSLANIFGFIESDPLNKIRVVIVLTIIYVINYFNFVKRTNYEFLNKKYESDLHRNSPVAKFAYLLFIILSIILPIALGYAIRAQS